MDFADNNYFLIKRLIKGDEKAYEYLMDAYYQRLCVYAFTLTNDHSKAEDIVQNVFVKVWTGRKKLNPDFLIRNFLYKSVYNEFINEYRKNKSVLYLEKKYFEAIDMVMENEQDNFEEIIKLVYLEINNLPSKCKHIFLLNKKEGLTHTEISELLGISIKTIEAHISRAFKILEEKLGQKYKTILFILFSFKNELEKQISVAH
ncbi:RNA polymerase sigma factor [Sinomicrobium weinanense]|uniref:RNA polymerase sigma-70 factor n=1 Tax=Sinomicrobium weinanense TaxID=2842200 RepID=A0A926Q5B6_9FLAO|nr:RNA polymerase sigma-70 factor [Sinomicrobium weinanense]MBC9797981.1 RNA polymerase sigma-70 factor [Sinomicrobium weinanense]MBU3125502.1 RNA polymerase sigma-70 factor [Sinomicrobium weinanense]